MGALQLEQRATASSTALLHGLMPPWRDSRDHENQHQRRRGYDYSGLSTCAPVSPDPASDSVHQTGTSYSSNNAGDGPEKTRDRKSWFPRFKSNWLGTFRSKQMFHCCECAVVPPTSASSLSSQAGRYKGAEGKHCRCGKDQWHLAKSVEETEYNRRMEISKALGGMRYDEAVLRLRSMGQSELDFKPSEHMVNAGSPTQLRSTRGFAPASSSSLNSNLPKRVRSVSSGPLPTPVTRTYAAPQLMKSELSTLPTMSSHMYAYENPAKQYGAYTPVYGSNGIEYTHAAQPQHSSEYEQLTPAPFGDEEGFGELLQGILEDDPRVAAGANIGLSPNQANAYAGARYGYYAGAPAANGSVAPLKRTMSMPSYAMTPSMMVSPPREGSEQEYYDPTRRASLNQVPAYVNYQQHAPQQQPMLQQQFPYQQQEPQVYSRSLSMTPSSTATSTSFST
ncbi:hypothetical protein JG687_00001141 [Phytophthora cactorum]|uniref:Uncharacterized protein n=1 Tax=Phytophthora cactorum TaxID=29920 RepID=A0A329S9E3_9STRA|nr:hypothetical protein Pcac1_g13552 [Phytophthora cactorum]KAG2840853.1 hypothetical protein PC112_g3589 [Phytophthora cactorum]KAG2842636.1 hypothetical protein PC111_g2649 [Phytophthora cactorum]KAG2867368.1 hypothetical protein PC113_g2035 [Phytophthora cactorum]KAG2924879.1 hypothetical protein PC114_g4334 [Phytophthora cactorum]